MTAEAGADERGAAAGEAGQREVASATADGVAEIVFGGGIAVPLRTQAQAAAPVEPVEPVEEPAPVEPVEEAAPVEPEEPEAVEEPAVVEAVEDEGSGVEAVDEGGAVGDGDALVDDRVAGDDHVRSVTQLVSAAPGAPAVLDGTGTRAPSALRPSAPRPVVLQSDDGPSRRVRSTAALVVLILASASGAALAIALTIAAIALGLRRVAG